MARYNSLDDIVQSIVDTPVRPRQYDAVRKAFYDPKLRSPEEIYKLDEAAKQLRIPQDEAYSRGQDAIDEARITEISQNEALEKWTESDRTNLALAFPDNGRSLAEISDTIADAKKTLDIDPNTGAPRGDAGAPPEPQRSTAERIQGAIDIAQRNRQNRPQGFLESVARLPVSLQGAWALGEVQQAVSKAGLELRDMWKAGASEDAILAKRQQIASLSKASGLLDEPGMLGLFQSVSQFPRMFTQDLPSVARYAMTGAIYGGATGMAFGGVGAVPGFTAGLTAGAMAGVYEATRASEEGAAFAEWALQTDDAGNFLPLDQVSRYASLYGHVAGAVEVLGDRISFGAAKPVIGAIKGLIAKEAGGALAKEAARRSVTAPVMTFLKSMGQSMFGQGLEEGLQEAAQIGAETVMKNVLNSEGRSYFRAPAEFFTKENLEQIWEATEGGLAMGWWFGLLPMGTTLVSQEILAKRARDFASAHKAIAQKVGAHELHEKAPERLETYLQASGMTGDVLIPADALQELDQKGLGIADTLGYDPQTVDETARQGQDIRIAASTLHSMLSVEQMTAVSDIMKEAPDAISLEDASTLNENLGADVQEAARNIEKAAEKIDKTVNEVKRLNRELTQAVEASPRLWSQLTGESAPGDKSAIRKFVQSQVNLALKFAKYRELHLVDKPPVEDFLSKITFQNGVLQNFGELKQGMVRDEEIDEVRTQYSDRPDAYMKAPNGEQSKLNERQWLQVRTRSFKNWFGDWEKDPKNSGVLDENGEPMLVYHGTRAEVTDDFAFDPEKVGLNGVAEGAGFYVTTDMGTAQSYQAGKGGLITAYANVRNPMPLNQKAFSNSVLKKIVKRTVELQLAKYPEDIESWRDTFISDITYTHDGRDLDYHCRNAVAYAKENAQGGGAVAQLNSLLSAGAEHDLLSRATTEVTGFDGISSNGYRNKGERGGNIIVAWSPSQIKSATGNIGSFRTNDERIYYATNNIDPEMEAVRERYANRPSEYMKAPNGEDTNLSERQWLQVRTEAFKKWFGDWEKHPFKNSSFALDRNGEPLLMYHGTPAEVGEGFAFDPSKIGKRGTAWGPGFYFTSNEKYAETYKGKEGGNVLPVYLNIRNPMDAYEGSLEEGALKNILTSLIDELKSEGAFDLKSSFLKDLLPQGALEGMTEEEAVSKAVEGLREFDAAEEMNRLVKAYGDAEIVFGAVRDETGYDGIEEGAPTRLRGKVYIPWFPEQIKSATGNIGTFNPEDERIFYQGIQASSRKTKDIRFLNELLFGDLSTMKKIHQTAVENLTKNKKAEDLTEAEMMKSPLYKNVKLMLEYPGLGKIKKSIGNLTFGNLDNALEGIIDHMVKNLRSLVRTADKLGPEIRERTSRWYDGAEDLAKRWSKKYNTTLSTVAGVIAVLSPQKNWYENVTLAERILDIVLKSKKEIRLLDDPKMLEVWNGTGPGREERRAIDPSEEDSEEEGGEVKKPKKAKKVTSFPSLKPSKQDERSVRTTELCEKYSLQELVAKGEYLAAAYLLRTYDQAHNSPWYRILQPEGGIADWARKGVAEEGVERDKTPVRWQSYDVISKAIAIIADPSASSISSILGDMHKVRNFYNNILVSADPRYATIDTHAVAAALYRPLSSNDIEVNHNFGAGTSNSSVEGSSGTYGIILEAYRRAAEKEGITARQLQSITWEVSRALFGESFKSKEKKREKRVADLSKDAYNEWKKEYDKKAAEAKKTKSASKNKEEKSSAPEKKSKADFFPNWSEYGPEDKALTRAIWEKYDNGLITDEQARQEIYDTAIQDKPEGKRKLTFAWESVSEEEYKNRFVINDTYDKEGMYDYGAEGEKSELSVFLGDTAYTAEDAHRLALLTMREFGIVGDVRFGAVDGGPCFWIRTEDSSALLPASHVLASLLETDSVAIFSPASGPGLEPRRFIGVDLPFPLGREGLAEVSRKLPDGARTFLLDSGKLIVDGIETIPDGALPDGAVTRASICYGIPESESFAPATLDEKRVEKEDWRKLTTEERYERTRRRVAKEFSGGRLGSGGTDPVYGTSYESEARRRGVGPGEGSPVRQGQARGEGDSSGRGETGKAGDTEVSGSANGAVRSYKRGSGESSVEFTASLDGAKAGKGVWASDISVGPEDRTFLSEDGKRGFAISPDGRLTAFFAPTKEEAMEVLRDAVPEGASKAVVPETSLATLMGLAGYRTLLRTPFKSAEGNIALPSPEELRGHHMGTPDILFMAYDEEWAGGYLPNDGETVMGGDFAEARERLDAVSSLIDKGRELSPEERSALRRRFAGERETGIAPQTLRNAPLSSFGENSDAESILPQTGPENGAEGLQQGGASTVIKSWGPNGLTSILDGGRYAVSLFERANLSTVAHELSHVFFLDMQRVIREGGADERMQQDWHALENWLKGLDDPEKLRLEYVKYKMYKLFGNKDFENLTERELQRVRWRASQEWLARGFEQYLRSGVPPSPQLLGLFARFKEWMLRIYRSALDLNVDITPEVSDVFDRIIGCDVEMEVRAAQMQIRDESRQVLDNLDLSNQERLDLENKIALAKTQAADKTRRLRDRARNKNLAEWRREAQEEARKEPAQELKRKVRAYKIDRESVRELVGDEAMKRMLKALPGAVVGEGTDGVDIRVVAQELGYEDATAMVREILDSPSLGQRVQAIVKEKEAAHDSTVDPAEVLCETKKVAEQQEKIAQALVRKLRGILAEARYRNEVEGKTLKTRPVNVSPEALEKFHGKEGLARWAIAKAQLEREASDYLDSIPASKACSPELFRIQAANYMQKERRAIIRKDFHNALVANYKARINIELASQAAERRDLMDKITKQAKRMIQMDRADPNARFSAFLITRAIGLFRPTRKMLANAGDKSVEDNVMAFLRECVSFGYLESVDDIPRGAFTTGPYEWGKMPWGEMRPYIEALVKVITIERQMRKIKTAEGERDLQEYCEEIANSIRTHNKNTNKGPFHQRGKLEKLLKSIHTAHLTADTMALLLDGDNMGPAWKAIIKPLNDATWNRAERLAKAQKEIQQIFSAYSHKELCEMKRTKFLVDGIDHAITKEQAICMLLNSGNAGNRQRLLSGHGITEEQLADIIDRLDERDVRFAQRVWDHLESYRLESFDLEESLTGVRPEAVEAVPIQTKYGRLRGGYYPAVYDGDKSSRASADAPEVGVQSRAMFASVEHGSMKRRSRGGLQAPLRLSLRVVPEAVVRTCHMLAFRRAVVDVSKILRRSEVNTAIQETMGIEVSRSLDSWLKYVAGERPISSGYDKVAGWLRMKAAFASMAFKLSTMLAQTCGLLYTIPEIGMRWTLAGVADMFAGGNPLRAYHTVCALSPMMRHRMNSLDREIFESSSDIVDLGQSSKFHDPLARMQRFIQKKGFLPMAYVQMYMADLPTWLGAYKKRLSETHSMEEAIDYADTTVTRTQGGGSEKDLAAVQRGRELGKLMTMYYTVFGALYNLSARRVTMVNRSRDIASTFRLGTLMLLAWFAEPVITGMCQGKGPDDDEPDLEDWLLWGAKEAFFNPFQMIVGVRDVANAVESNIEGIGKGFAFGTANSSVDAMLKPFFLLAKMAQDGGDPDTGKKLAIASVKGVGQASGLVPSQAILALEAFWDWLDGTSPEFEVQSLLRREQKKR